MQYVGSWQQLKKVSLPVFKGEVRKYESWRAAFMACVDQSPLPAYHKLLYLRDYLGGEALQAVDSLPYTPAAYQAALERLERKYGGERRRIALYLENLQTLKQVRHGKAKDMERFVETLDVLVVNLRDSARQGELGAGTFYMNMLRKLDEQTLADYKRWVASCGAIESVEVLLMWATQESQFLTEAAETLTGLDKDVSQSTSQQSSSSKNVSKAKVRSFVTVADKKPTILCGLCEGKHAIWKCPEFSDMTVQKRWEKARSLKLCFRCLGHGHSGNNCSRSRPCGVQGCTETHNRLLHRVKAESDETTASKSSSASREKGPSTEGGATAKTTVMMNYSKRPVMLRTIPIRLRKDRKNVTVNALLDDGSTQSYLNSDVAAELGISTKQFKVAVSTLNGRVEELQTMSVECQVESLDGSYIAPFSAITADQVTGDMKAHDWRLDCSKYAHLAEIPFPEVGKQKSVDLLIGLDNAELHFSLEDVKGQAGEPIARKTPLGWTCVGSNQSQEDKVESCGFSRVYFNHQSMDALVRQMWDLESPVSSQSQYSPREQEILAVTKDSLVRVEGRYQVGIPWKQRPPSINGSYEVALKRLKSTESRLRKDPVVANEYCRVLRSHEEKGYIRLVRDEARTGWFMPHFAVTRLQAATTKVRVVFDASAKVAGVCLNDYIHVGPKLQRELPNVLLRFRQNPVALVADVAEMYLQIQLPEEDRLSHRFLWRDMNSAVEPKMYEYNRVVFGVNASPYLAQFVSQQHAIAYQEQYPRAAETILKSTYMDDSMDSAEDDHEAIQLYKQLTQVWNLAGMHARKWISNSAEVLAHVPPDDRAGQINLEEGVLPTTKTLGVTWQAADDVFRFVSKPPTHPLVFTKRAFLKKLATLFDPIGFVAPFVVLGRIIFQEMWSVGADWDDQLPKSICAKVSKWYDQLEQLDGIKIPRCLRLDSPEVVKSSALHVFSDASQEAYGAVAYLRHEYLSGEVSCRIVAAKTKVAPLSAVSIPRLELMAAVLGCRLGASVADALNLSQLDRVMWTDSMNVIWWIRNLSRRFKPFVAHRIAEIHEKTDSSQWFHTPTDVNPADLASRGATASQLVGNQQWENGPEYLLGDRGQWPPQPADVPKPTASELRKSVVVSDEHDGMVKQTSLLSFLNVADWRLAPEKFSSLSHLIRVTAWVMRFVNNCQCLADERMSGNLSHEEIADAEMCVFRSAQREEFPQEYKMLSSGKPIPATSPLRGLLPVLDEYGVMRLSGRLQNAEFLPYEMQHPILLPRNSWVTLLVIRHQHEMDNHVAGTSHTLSKLMEKYWIVAGREAIREWERICSECKRRKAKPAVQVMAPLPQIRLKEPLRAFGRVAVDYAGPFITIQGRGQRRAKRYLCVFTCLACRAVHLEMASGLDTNSFMNAFQRMCNRRGVPEEVLSDNGSNFIGAERELSELFDQQATDEITELTKDLRIKWSFLPPLSPHFGGVHESMVKSAKKSIYAILGNADVNDEELMTAFSGAEALMNSRPITPPSSDHRDDMPLTPNHFVAGHAGRYAVQADGDHSLRKRWRRIQELLSHFWKRWMREWVPSLNRRSKWTTEEKNMKVGDVVLVVSSDTPRGKWPLGRVVEIKPGSDGKVRVVQVEVGGKIMLRPINRLCPIVSE